MLKVFEMFSGYGGASFALKKLGVEFEIVGYSEIDKFAVQCYNQNHLRWSSFTEGIKPTPYGDCTKIDVNILPNFDLLTGGFPCQSFSVAGKGLGELDTRGTLFNDIIRIAEVKQPKYMLLENVKGLLSKRHKPTFDKILRELDRIGYSVTWKVLNTKDYGIPQNRERVFFVCFRKDIIHWFTWPETKELDLFLKDILEIDVDEKYYLTDEQTKKLLFNPDSLSSYRTRNLIKGDFAPTLQAAMSHGNTIPLVKINNATKKGYLEAAPGDGINLEQPNSKTRRGRVQPGMSSTLQTNDQRGVLLEDERIRKLTPKECFRLMGFIDDKINLNSLSNTQRYKLAGNGWDINLVSKIFDKMRLT